MSDDLEARIRKTEDFQAVTNLQAQYSFLVDESRLDELVELFAEPFVWEVGFDETKMTTFTSKPKLLAFLQRADQATPMMRHQPLTPYIEIDGDTATGAWYLVGMITSVTPEGPAAKWVQGKYDNEYVRVDGGWLISRLRFVYNFLTPYDEGWVRTPRDPFLS